MILWPKAWNQYWWAKISLAVGLYSLQRPHSLPLPSFDFPKGAQGKSIPCLLKSASTPWLVATSLQFLRTASSNLSLLHFHVAFSSVCVKLSSDSLLQGYLWWYLGPTWKIQHNVIIIIRFLITSAKTLLVNKEIPGIKKWCLWVSFIQLGMEGEGWRQAS